MNARAGRALGGLMIVLLVVACGGSGASSSSSRSSLIVLAASSLRNVFPQLGREFEKAHPGVKVSFSFGNSATLAKQVDAGAPADVFASASQSVIQPLARNSKIVTPAAFARNRLVIVVRPGNPQRIHQLADLTRSGVKLALCQSSAPCGTAADSTFAKAHLTVHPATREADAGATLTKLELGEVDAAVVYVTDAKSAGPKVAPVVIPAAENTPTTLAVAAVRASTQGSNAQAFVDEVLSASGRSALTAAGFDPP